MAGCNVCFIIALERIDTATVFLLQALAPFTAALLGWLVHRESVDKHTWISMVVAVIGVAIMGSGWGQSDPAGIAAASAIAVMLGAYSVVLRGASDAAPEPRAQLFFNGVVGLALVVLVICISMGTESLLVPLHDAMCGLSAGGFCLGVGLPL